MLKLLTDVWLGDTCEKTRGPALRDDWLIAQLQSICELARTASAESQHDIPPISGQADLRQSATERETTPKDRAKLSKRVTFLTLCRIDSAIVQDERKRCQLWAVSSVIAE
jgi:hypothetical protein